MTKQNKSHKSKDFRKVRIMNVLRRIDGQLESINILSEDIKKKLDLIREQW